MTSEQREARIEALLAGAKKAAALLDEIPDEPNSGEAFSWVILRLSEVNFKLDAILTSLSIGEEGSIDV